MGRPGRTSAWCARQRPRPLTVAQLAALRVEACARELGHGLAPAGAVDGEAAVTAMPGAPRQRPRPSRSTGSVTSTPLAEAPELFRGGPVARPAVHPEVLTETEVGAL
eukprot:1526807-Alexandrium_andersonii.AAC.1